MFHSEYYTCTCMTSILIKYVETYYHDYSQQFYGKSMGHPQMICGRPADEQVLLRSLTDLPNIFSIRTS